MKMLIDKHPVVFLIVFSLLMLGIGFSFLEVSIMEARNLITAREMVTDGNWILTTMNGEARYQKPPLPSWLAAAMMLAFGMKSILMLRLPGILMVCLVSVLIYKLSLKMKLDRQHAIINGLIAATSFYIAAIVIEAPWDIYTHGFMLAAIYLIYAGFSTEQTKWSRVLLAALFIGLSILSKGPIGFYASLLPFLLAFFICEGVQSLKRNYKALLTMLLFGVVLGISWYAYVRFADADTFTRITEKETSNWSSYNIRPFYYYWSFFTQSGIWTIPALASMAYWYLRKHTKHPKVYKLVFLWTVIALILLSVIPEKKSRYLMPVLIPLAFNIGFYIEILSRKSWEKLKLAERIPVLLHFGIIGLLSVLIPIAGFVVFLDKPNTNWVIFALSVPVLFGIAFMMLKSLLKANFIKGSYLTVAFVFAVVVFYLPQSKLLRSENNQPLSEFREQLLSSEIPLYYKDYIAPEMIWDYGEKIPEWQFNSTEVKIGEKTIAILAKSGDDPDQWEFGTAAEIELLGNPDLNIAEPGSSSYNKRLVSRLYLVHLK